MPRFIKKMGKVVDPASLTESLHKGIRNQVTRAIDVKKAELATNPALPKTPPTAESMVDAHPVKMEYSPHGDVLDLDGRHRVMQAIERGDERINLQLTARDGGISNISVDPKYVAEKFGVTKESLAGTDAAQPYRAGNLQSRPAEMMPASKDAAKLQADAESAAAKPVKNGSADLIEKAEPAASTSPQSTSMRKIGDNASQDFHNLASSDYKVIDDASRGDLKELQNRIENNKRELRRLTDSEEDAKKAASIELRQKDTEQAIEDIFDDLDKKGIDHAVIQRARNSHKAAMAADEFSTRMKRSGVVEGANPDSTGPLAKELNKSNPETVNPSAYHKRVIEPLFNSGRLQDFVGPKIAEEMFDHSLEHAAAYDKIMRNRANAIGLARTVGRSALQTMGLGGLGYGVYHLTREH